MSADDKVELPRDQPVGQLPPQDWMILESTKRVVSALTANGSEMRFVGGCVRNSLTRKPVDDIDIAIPDRPDQVIALLEQAGLRAIPTGVEHGTVTALVDGRRYEITSLRVDAETFGRRARVVFTDDWVADAQRRDFTINALYCTPSGAIYDPCEGLADLGIGRVRFIGDAMSRIDEDALRILRFFRFYAEFGSPPPDREALLACREGAKRLKDLSGERIAAEIMKVLAVPDPAHAMLLMHGEAALADILPEAKLFGRLRLLTFIETRGILRPDVSPDMLRRLAALLPDSDAAERVAARFRMSNADTSRLVAMTSLDIAPFPAMGVKPARRMLHMIGSETFRDRALLAWAGRLAEGAHRVSKENHDWGMLLDLARDWQPKQRPVTGADVMALGVPPGPRLGALLARLDQWWIEGDFSADKNQALAWLKSVIDSGDPRGD